VGWGTPKIAVMVVLAVMVVPSCHGKRHERASLCDTLGVPVTDEMVVTVAAARSWGPQSRDGSATRLPGYAPTDQLALCLSDNGDVFGVLARDHHTERLWHQTSHERIVLPG
jgi:hypothetical protein